MALASKPFAAGDKLNPEVYIGKTYLLIVERRAMEKPRFPRSRLSSNKGMRIAQRGGVSPLGILFSL